MPPDPPRTLRPMATADQLSRTQTFPPTYKKILYETLYGPTYVFCTQNSTLNMLVWGSLVLAQWY